MYFRNPNKKYQWLYVGQIPLWKMIPSLKKWSSSSRIQSVEIGHSQISINQLIHKMGLVNCRSRCPYFHTQLSQRKADIRYPNLAVGQDLYQRLLSSRWIVNQMIQEHQSYSNHPQACYISVWYWFRFLYSHRN